MLTSCVLKCSLLAYNNQNHEQNFLSTKSSVFICAQFEQSRLTLGFNKKIIKNMIPPFKTVGHTCNFGWKNKFKIHWTALNYYA